MALNPPTGGSHVYLESDTTRARAAEAGPRVVRARRCPRRCPRRSPTATPVPQRSNRRRRHRRRAVSRGSRRRRSTGRPRSCTRSSSCCSRCTSTSAGGSATTWKDLPSTRRPTLARVIGVSAGPSIPLAFLAGLVSFLSPCVFPLMPAYAAYLSGRAGQPALAGAPGGTVTRLRPELRDDHRDRVRGRLQRGLHRRVLPARGRARDHGLPAQPRPGQPDRRRDHHGARAADHGGAAIRLARARAAVPPRRVERRRGRPAPRAHLRGGLAALPRPAARRHPHHRPEPRVRRAARS